MSRLISNFVYRPEIDGLRAVAVLSVVLFHAGLGLSGGYIGVDVFFVISGYLITSLIVKELESDSFTLSNFWERRARRILPAMSVMVLVTMVAGWILLLPSDYKSLGASTAWQAVFGANIHFWLDTGYFAGAAEEKPLLHTWSLAVEEQFYMVMPFLLLVLFRIRAFRGRHVLLALFAFGIAASLLSSVYGVARHPSAAFYLLPTRAWELLCGGFVAILPSSRLQQYRALREGLSLLGITCILVASWVYTKSTPFPGLAAIPPCLGTALFIWSSGGGACATLPSVARLLASRPFVFVGLISYSLYLWHWPILAFSTYWALEPLPLGYRLGMVGLGFVLAILSWRYVETPFRKRKVCDKRIWMFAFGAASVSMATVMGCVVSFGGGFPGRIPPEALAYASAKDDMAGTHEVSAEDINSDHLPALGVPDPALPVSLLLWGDSHAMAAASAFDKFLKDSGQAGRQATLSATAPVIGASFDSEFTRPEDAIAFNNAVLQYVQRHGIPTVVLVGYWEHYHKAKGIVPIDKALINTIEKLVQAGTRPYLLLQVPHQRISAPKALAMASMFGTELGPLMLKQSDLQDRHLAEEAFLSRLKTAGCRILDPFPAFLDPAGNHYIIEKDGLSIYRDAHHLSASGASKILTPFLQQELKL